MSIKIGGRPAKQVIKAYTDVLTFGKHKGRTIEYVLDNDPGYIVWLVAEDVAYVSTEIYSDADRYMRQDYGDGYDMYDYFLSDDPPY